MVVKIDFVILSKNHWVSHVTDTFAVSPHEAMPTAWELIVHFRTFKKIRSYLDPGHDMNITKVGKE